MNPDLNMKHHPQPTSTRQRAMTLIELLVVISIIGVLAGLIMPAMANAKKKAKVMQTQKEMSDIKGAINAYQHDYNRLPGSSSASQLGADFTYGTRDTGYGTNIDHNGGVGYQASNAELMLILTASQSFPGYTTNSCNANDARNPRKTGYFNAKNSGAGGAAAGAGLGTDGVMRDPWGNPYIVALDLNYDGWVSNSVYKLDGVVSTFSVGQVQQSGANTWALKDSVMIFSFGPDGAFSTGVAANAGVNRDNVLSWK